MKRDYCSKETNAARERKNNNYKNTAKINNHTEKNTRKKLGKRKLEEGKGAKFFPRWKEFCAPS